MIEIVTTTLGLLGQFATLSQNKTIKPAIKGLSDWIGKLFTKKSEKKTLNKVLENTFNEKTISDLKDLLESKLKTDNEKLKELVEETNEKIKEAGLEKEVARNTIEITGNKNIAIQNVNTSGGDFIVNKPNDD